MFNAFELYLFGFATLLNFITAVQYFSIARKKENPNERSINIAYSFIFIFFTFYWIFYTLSYLNLSGFYIGQNYWGTFNNPSLTHEWLMKSTYISYFAAFIFYFKIYEKIIGHKISVALISYIIVIALMIILPYEFVIFQLYTYTWSLTAIIFMHSLFKLMKWSHKELRSASSFIILGSLLIGMVDAYRSPLMVRLGVMLQFLMPIVLIIGIFLCLIPTIIDPKFFKQKMNYWYLFSAILIGIGIFNTIYVISSIKLIELWLVTLVLLILYVVECGFAIKYIKKEEKLGLKKGDIVEGVFTKPQRIKEEDVTFYREKAVCLVCKSNVSEFSYICRQCKALYCQKCVRALTEMENACWVCEAPFDKSKPVKVLPSTKEDEISIEKEDLTKKEENLKKKS